MKEAKIIYDGFKDEVLNYTRSLIGSKKSSNIQSAEIINNYLNATDDIIHLLTMNNVALRVEVKAHEESLKKLMKDKFANKDDIMRAYLQITNDFRDSNKDLPI